MHDNTLRIIPIKSDRSCLYANSSLFLSLHSFALLHYASSYPAHPHHRFVRKSERSEVKSEQDDRGDDDEHC